MNAGEKISLLPFLDITHLNNTGMAFSLFTGNNTALLIINAVVIVIIGLVAKLSKEKKGPAYLAYGFILGGALSNKWDRYFYQGVIDYIDFKIWPVFNIADTAITIGALLIAYAIITDYLSLIKKRNKCIPN
jgi:signal peptidase II